MPVTLILGGARSGKSRYAETTALSLSENPIYIATAPLIENDAEWMQRIEHHRNERSKNWQLIEEEIAIVSILEKYAMHGNVVLIDCITLWLSNLSYRDKDIDQEVEQLCDLLPTISGQVILIANEVGMGLVPDNPEGRIFRDAQGRLNQRLAALADHVEFVAAGLPICLKGEKA